MLKCLIAKKSFFYHQICFGFKDFEPVRDFWDTPYIPNLNGHFIYTINSAAQNSFRLLLEIIIDPLYIAGSTLSGYVGGVCA